MKECPGCKRTYDDSWRVCLVCETDLHEGGEPVSEDGLGFDQFPGNKFLIVVFSLFLMMLAPVLIIVAYLTYFQAFDVGSKQYKDRQLKEAVVFEKEDKADEDEYGL